jgi:hypothetical protein
MSIVQFEDEVKEKVKKISKKKAIHMNDKPKISQVIKQNEMKHDNNIFSGLQPDEINFLSNDLLIKSSTLLIKPNKRVELYNRLKTSKYINLYIDNYLNLNFLDSFLNDHYKLILSYAVHYISTSLNNNEIKQHTE